MGVLPITVSRYRKFAEEHGYLEVVKPGKFRPGKGSRADELRFDLDKVELPVDEAGVAKEQSPAGSAVEPISYNLETGRWCPRRNTLRG